MTHHDAYSFLHKLDAGVLDFDGFCCPLAVQKLPQVNDDLQMQLQGLRLQATLTGLDTGAQRVITYGVSKVEPSISTQHTQ